MVFKKRNICSICIIIVLGTINQGTWSQEIEVSYNVSHSGLVYGPVENQMQCFQCNSWQEAGCSVIKPPFDASNPLLRPCPFRRGPLPHCIKIVKKRQEFKGDLVIRKCAWRLHLPPDCKEEKFTGGSEINCQCFQNACNSAPSFPHLATPATAAAGLLVLVGFGGQ